jgi:RNA polymerase sigma-70 factor (ECF subfamily)
MNEKQLIKSCLNGDRCAQEELYNLYARKMMGLCLRYVGDRETARDLLQDGFIKVFTTMHLYSGTGTFESWVRMVFINCLIAYVRKKDVLRDSVDLGGINEWAEEETAVAKLSAERIFELVQQLPSGFRSVFNLYAVEGYSHREIGKMLDITESTSRSQYTRARQWLQAQIKQMELVGFS